MGRIRIERLRETSGEYLVAAPKFWPDAAAKEIDPDTGNTL
jgi:hypothetical protein